MTLTEQEVVETVATLDAARLRLWIREGWVVPAERDGVHVFDELDLARIRLVYQLRDELDVGDEAVPVVLSLLDQVHGLRRGLRALLEAIEQQPEPVRQEIRAALCTGAAPHAL